MSCTYPRSRAAWACAWLLLAAAPAYSQATGDKEPEKRATLMVSLPADARLLVDGKETRQTGSLRRFYSPPLPTGRTFRYELEATWTGPDGKPVRVKKIVRVSAGERIPVDLRTGDAPPADVPPIVKPPAGKPDREPDVVYLPTPQEVVDKMLELAKVTKDDVVYDLGCGDGRIVVTAAKKYGCKAVGFDIDPDRVAESLANVKKNDVADLVTIQNKDFFTVDLSKASVVTLYLLPSLNLKLVPQLNKMKPGSRIVSHSYDMEGRIPPKQKVTVMDKEGKPHDLYLWVVPLPPLQKD
jgi:uncharacterized protein (TIGR03000 family)